MKKVLSISLILTMIISLMALVAYSTAGPAATIEAAAGPAATITAATSTIAASAATSAATSTIAASAAASHIQRAFPTGSNAQITVVVEMTADESVYAAQFDLQFDATKLALAPDGARPLLMEWDDESALQKNDNHLLRNNIKELRMSGGVAGVQNYQILGDVIAYTLTKTYNGSAWDNQSKIASFTFDILQPQPQPQQQQQSQQQSQNQTVEFALDNIQAVTLSGGAPVFIDVVTDVYATDTAYMYLKGPSSVVSGAGATATYTVAAVRMPETYGIELEFEVDGEYLASSDFSALNGFSIVGAGNYGTKVFWTNNGSIWTGKITLLNLSGAGGGSGGSGGAQIPISGDVDIFEMVFNVKEGALGPTYVKLNYVKLSAAGATVSAVIADGMVATILEQYYSPYDLNKDGVIDINDLTFALQYFLITDQDDEWEAAKVAEFFIDGIIDINDLILILANYTIPYYN